MEPTFTKAQEIERTVEVCREILEREGPTRRGVYFLLAFVHDTGRPLPEVLPFALAALRGA